MTSWENFSCRDNTNRCIKVEGQISASLPSLITQPLSLDFQQWLSTLDLLPLFSFFTWSRFMFFTWLPFLTFKTLKLPHSLQGVMLESPFLMVKLIPQSMSTHAAGNSTSAHILTAYQVLSTKLKWMSYWYSHTSEHRGSGKLLFFRQVKVQEEVTIQPRSMDELAL